MPSIPVQRASIRTRQAMIRLSAVVSHRGSIRDVPNEVWDTLVNDLAKTIESVENIKVNAVKFCKVLRDMLTVMTSLSTDFSGSLIDKDSQEVKDSRQCYCEGVASLRANCIIQGISILEDNLIPYLQEFIFETMDLQKLCEERFWYKLNHDHYVQKVDAIMKDPNHKEDKLRRVRFLHSLKHRIKKSFRIPRSNSNSSKLPCSIDSTTLRRSENPRWPTLSPR
ncbi:uncharacterized protein [Blastocystis hominis]|uniref:Uncharacterized protein n=1 Tax=Blastocystis hominis TaxID=12968 RepID=D8LX77_BLAHO|nr:uncharacterized protein [Blastocystis hominis]CBK20872.2 unnamed protein product [Blastocystis hominis]|eukprot:XP_012894920.1 uncharacterized protein [Blastocystis hominis]